MQYVKAKDNVVVDAPSHCPLANAIYMVRNTMMREINKYYTQDHGSKKLMRTLKKNIKPLKLKNNIKHIF
jgi:hypothetical protein